MRNRILVPIGILILALAGAGTAAAATGVFESNDSGLDSPRDIVERGTVVTQPATSTPVTSVPEADDGEADDRDETPVDLADGATQTFPAGDACSVTVHRDGNVLSVVSVTTSPGFASEVEQGTGAEVEVKCESGTTRVDFNAEIEDGSVQVEVRERTDAPDAVQTTAPGVPPTTPTTEPEDNSGPGDADDGDATTTRPTTTTRAPAAAVTTPRTVKSPDTTGVATTPAPPSRRFRSGLTSRASGACRGR